MLPSADVALLAMTALGLLTAAGACSDDALEAAGTVTDSAGVRVVVSREQPGATFATVDTTPLLALGGVRAEGVTQFYRVQTVWVDGNGRLWVVDGQSAELRIFGLDGSHWKTVGSLGQGPEQFFRPQLLGSFRGDSVAVWDQGNARLTVLNDRAEIRRVTRLQMGDRAVPKAYDVFPDGSLLVQFPRPIPPPAPGTILRDSVRLERLDLRAGRSLLVADVEGPRWLWTGREQVPVPFTINAGFDLEDGRVHLASGPDFRVRVFEGGTLREIYGVERPAREVRRSDLDAYTPRIEALAPEGRVDAYLQALDHPSRPTRLPAWSEVVLADDGKAWARVYSPDPLAPGRWDVFATDRRWLGTVEVAAGFHLVQVGRGILVGVWYDELGTESVRVYGFDEVGE